MERRQAVVAHAFDPSTQEAEAGRFEFEASLDYREFQNCQSYTEKLCLKNKNKTERERENTNVIGPHSGL